MHRYNTPPSFLKIVLGDHDRTRFEKTQISVGIEKVSVHPGYVGIRNYWRHDVALLKLDSDVKFTKYIRPICLPWASCEDDVSNCYCTGWGKDGNNPHWLALASPSNTLTVAVLFHPALPLLFLPPAPWFITLSLSFLVKSGDMELNYVRTLFRIACILTNGFTRFTSSLYVK